MAEVYELSDRVSVLRDGQYIGSLTREQLNASELVRMMVGRPLSDLFNKDRAISFGEIRGGKSSDRQPQSASQQPRGARRGDCRAGRAGRCRPQRAGAADFGVHQPAGGKSGSTVKKCRLTRRETPLAASVS